jgi:hypothetical protein
VGTRTRGRGSEARRGLRSHARLLATAREIAPTERGLVLENIRDENSARERIGAVSGLRIDDPG